MATQPQAVLPDAQDDTLARTVDREVLKRLGEEHARLFDRYKNDRQSLERKWLRNLRQYLGIYDPEIESRLAPDASRAYPRLTRVKCVNMLSRIMNLMFPGNERNWEVKASPSPDMDIAEVMDAVEKLMERRKAEGLEGEPDDDILDAAVQELADKRACDLSRLIDDQLQELGGDQTLDYVLLNRQVALSGIKYGLGVLHGPFIREEPRKVWRFTENGVEPQETMLYKPQFEFRSVWDFYPDMAARTLPGDGFFLRMVMSKSGLRALGRRGDFMADEIKKIIRTHPNGNYVAHTFENELRSMGTRVEVNEANRSPNDRYEVLVWYGPINAETLRQCGAEVPEGYEADDIEAELWMVSGKVIKVDVNTWRKLGVQMRMIHSFVFDEDDTSPVGEGLPNVMRDSQLAVCAAARMALDNASITCGPNLEINLDLMRLDQDLTSIEARKIWYREGMDVAASYPAVRPVPIDSHLPELQALMTTFMQFADQETFASGVHAGGDMPSEPMRTAAGASMLRGDAALPFKDVVRNFDSFTQSVILSLVNFNKQYNPDAAPGGDYNVIPRGATSLVAKEVRGMQVDTLAQTLTDEEKDHIDMRKFARARLEVRDMGDLLVSESQAQINKEQRAAAMREQQDQQKRMVEAQIREVLAGSYKDLAQGRKNESGAEVAAATAALKVMEQAANEDDTERRTPPAR